jgi:hypothetical protein
VSEEIVEYVEAETVPFLGGWIDLPRYRRRTPAAPSEAVERHRATFARDWGKQLGAAVSDAEPTREPSVPGRDAASDEMPSPARKLADLARAGGWKVHEVYSRGPASDDSDGTEVVTVRCVARSAARWAAACYRRPGVKWMLAWCLLADRSEGLRRAKAAELKAYLAVS